MITAKPDAPQPGWHRPWRFSATLFDGCIGLVILSTLEKGGGQTTSNSKISLVRSITTETGLITADGVVLRRGRRVGTAEGRITDTAERAGGVRSASRAHT